MNSHAPEHTARVKLLPATLANQIAAGEVVERPSSVLKELLENSLDAGATRIEVDLEQGGCALIRVRDNGSGVRRDDLVLALRRHATSKIDTLGDLESLNSLGFRGEALPSIASVARLELSSRSVSDEQAYRVSADGSAEPTAPQPVSLPEGTVVVVRDLFFNTPARRKFLRTEKTEYRHADEVAKRIALSRFDIDMRFSHNAKTVWSVRPADTPAARVRRLSKLCGAPFCEHALAIEFEAPDSRLSGWIGDASFARNQPDLQHFFVNGRMIKDRVVSHAIRQAYEYSLPDGAHPAYVLFLDINPRRVDINVHPAKHEVRFRDSRSIHDFLFRAIKDSIEHSSNRALALDTNSSVPMTGGGSARSFANVSSTGTVREQVAAYARLNPNTARESRRTPSTHERSELSHFGRAVGEVSGRYLVAMANGALLLLDWPAARELIVYRRFRSMLEGDGAVHMKPLLIPAAVSATQSDVAVVERSEDILSVAGVEITLSGPTSVSLRQVPVVLGEFEPAVLVAELIRAVRSANGSAKLDELFRVLAAHDAARARLSADVGTLNTCLRELDNVAVAGEQFDFASWLDGDALASLCAAGGARRSPEND